MPRIPSREEPYHSVAKCNRHWKTKREFVTKAANKASHVDGSHYMLLCVTPKGNIEVHASEHFYDDASQVKLDGVINWEVLRRRVVTIQQRNSERWSEIERQEKRFGVEGEAEDDDGDDDEEVAGDGDRSLGEVSAPGTASSQGRNTPAPGQLIFSATKAMPTPVSTISVSPDTLEHEYCSRFEHLGQSVCANILKAWIKVVEPKKQTKFPYKDKKGNEGRPPPWWPTGMRHIEPDHLHKDERPRLLASIIQQASKPRAEGAAARAASTSPENRELTISRLHFATAEIASSIPPRQHYELRQIYLIAKEVRKAAEDRLRELRAQGIKAPEHGAGWSELSIDLFEKPPHTSLAGPAPKRSYDTDGAFDPARAVTEGKENNGSEYEPRASKRGKRVDAPVSDMHHQQALTPLASHQNVYAVHPYGMEHQHYNSWTSVPSIPVQSPSSSASNNTSSASLASSQQYYRPYVADMAQYPNFHPGSQYSAQANPAYSAQYPSYQINYQGSQSYPTSAGTPTSSQPQQQQTPTQPYSGYGYEQQTFVGDLAALPT